MSNQPESVKGLKTFSKKFLTDILKLNLKSLPDVVNNLSDSSFKLYEDGIGKAVVISNNIVNDPGTIDSMSDKFRNKLLGKNRSITESDLSELENGSGYSYNTSADDIGKPIQLSDYSVPTLTTIMSQFGLNSDSSMKVNMVLNKFIPQTFDQFSSKVLRDQLSLNLNRYSPDVLTSFSTRTIKDNSPQETYVDDNGQFSGNQNINTYTPSDILNINIKKNNYNYFDDPRAYLKFAGNVLQNETILMNIGALELRASFDDRINQLNRTEKTLTNNLTDAMSNPAEAVNILKDPINNLIGKDYGITKSRTSISKSDRLMGSLLGTYNIFDDIGYDDSVVYTPSCFNNNSEGNVKSDSTAFGRVINDLFGKSLGGDRDVKILSETGSGQKFQLFSNIYFNKYAPNYDPQYQSGVFQAIDKTLQNIAGVTGFLGMSGGKRPQSRYYLGDKTLADPFFIRQDSEGDLMNGSEDMTSVFKKNFDGGSDYYEPGYDEVSSYGSISSDFIWHKTNYNETFYDASTVKKNKNSLTYETTTKIEKGSGVDLTGKYSSDYYDSFRECSILYKTQRLLEKSDINSGINLSIDQTKTKFYDGYTLYPKGSGVLGVITSQKVDSQGNVIGNLYDVPGLVGGKRDATKLNDNAEFCRTWTKARPFKDVVNLMKYSELIRLERNSVIDRYNNYNIFPSSLNVNSYTQQESSKFGEYGQSTINDVTAKKYMFSIENLAWRDSKLFDGDDFPSSERGMNGGRVMWFPPYDLKFTDDTTANWTTHNFLGRPEPIYTYNSTERSGVLSFKIIVDHPTILNVLVQKELASMSDATVDEILNAFWSGCVNFDIYELARIWGKFSNNDISYLEQLISNIGANKTNEQIKSKIETSDAKSPTPIIKTNTTNNNKINNIKNSLFFENDVPLAIDDSKVNTYDVYFNTYTQLNNGTPGVQNSETTKGDVLNISKYISYDKVIGSNSSDKYFSVSPQIQDPKYKMYQGFTELQTDLTQIKTLGNNIKIDINSFTSSLDGKDTVYNTSLAKRRFRSVVKWVLFKILTGVVIKDSKGVVITIDTIDSYFTSNTLSVYRDSGVKDKLDTLTFNLSNVSILKPIDSMNSIGGVNMVGDIPISLITSGTTKTFICTDTTASKNSLLGSTVEINGIFYYLTNDNLGCLSPDRASSYSEADIVCSITSIQASYSRRVELNVGITQNPLVIKDLPKQTDTTTTTTNDQPQTKTNITKRDIAQKILNKLITEENYFKKIESDSPIIYKSIKEKLKYFTPAFHSMTPEGLNSRLTFLQQCLRPGDTIKSESSTKIDDATNTSFGKPPVCVLRIGDFYNTKIIINNCNITYEPLLYDLNPEGIGVQPMLANVNISFKYIGGSGLRKYVNELQNALSFNYYANTDVYDSRTFANTDPLERALVNLEKNPFDNNTLDLIPIVTKAKLIKVNDIPGSVPVGTIGTPVNNSLNLTYLGDTSYSIAKLTATTFYSGVIYSPDTYVTDNSTGIYGINYYKRLFDDTTNNNASANVAGKLLSDTKAWEFVDNKNFGQQFYLNLYGKSGTLETIDINYIDLYKNLYKSYLTNILMYQNFTNFDDKTVKKSKFLFRNIINKNFTGTSISGDNFLSTSMKGYKKQTVNPSTTNIGDYFGVHSNNSNYCDISKYSDYTSGVSNKQTSATQLHLYPQSLFYVKPRYVTSSDKTTMITGTTYNPGSIVNSDSVKSDVSGFYIKNNIKQDYLYYFYQSFINDINQKIDNDLIVFWFSDIMLFDNYNKTFTEPLRNIFKQYIKNQLSTYYNNSFTDYVNNYIDFNDNNNKTLYNNIIGLSYVLCGNDASVDGGNILSQYCVIPNGHKLTNDIEKLYGYDPYSYYLNILNINLNNNTDLVKLSDVGAKFVDPSSDIDKFMLMGNGAYFFRQISDASTIINSSVVKNNTGFDTNDSKIVLPKSIDIDISETTGDVFNFRLLSTTGKNTILFDTDNNVTNDQFNLVTASLGNKSGSNVLNNRYKMTYSYEKMSYEFFDFINKTLGVVINDNTYNYDISIGDYSVNTFKSRLMSALPVISDETYNILFPKTNDGFKYYNIITTGSTDSSYLSALSNLKSDIDYTVSLTDSFIDYNVLKNGGIVSTTISGLKGEANGFLMSSISEAMLLDFFEDLYTNRQTHIDSILKGCTDSLTKTSTNKNTNKIKNIISGFFDQVGDYVTKITDDLNSVIDLYNTNVYIPLDTYIKNGLGTPNNITSTVKTTPNSLLRGVDGDYTLTLRKAPIDSEVNQNNVIIFNSNRK